MLQFIFLGSMIHDEELVDDFLKTTSSLRERLSPIDTTHRRTWSLKDIAQELATLQVSPVTTIKTESMPPSPVSPIVPEWDYDDLPSPVADDTGGFAGRPETDNHDVEDILLAPEVVQHSLQVVHPSPHASHSIPMLSALDIGHGSFFFPVSPSSVVGTVDSGEILRLLGWVLGS